MLRPTYVEKETQLNTGLSRILSSLATCSGLSPPLSGSHKLGSSLVTCSGHRQCGHRGGNGADGYVKKGYTGCYTIKKTVAVSLSALSYLAAYSAAFAAAASASAFSAAFLAR
jgi:hypothetical protein